MFICLFCWVYISHGLSVMTTLGVFSMVMDVTICYHQYDMFTAAVAAVIAAAAEQVQDYCQ